MPSDLDRLVFAGPEQRFGKSMPSANLSGPGYCAVALKTDTEERKELEEDSSSNNDQM